MSTPEPEKLGRAIRVNKAQAAEAQLNTAIWLWFHNGDPVAIHTLAVAALDCFHAMGKMSGKPSIYGEWLSKQPKSIQDQATEAQNFFKHGFKNLKGYVALHFSDTEFRMLDSVFCHSRLSGSLPPLMRIYGARIVIEKPDFFAVDICGRFLDGLENIPELRLLDRTEFLEFLLPVFQSSQNTSI